MGPLFTKSEASHGDILESDEKAGKTMGIELDHLSYLTKLVDVHLGLPEEPFSVHHPIAIHASVPHPTVAHSSIAAHATIPVAIG